MASKQNLQQELSSFNKELDKHLSGVGINLLDENTFSPSSLSGDTSETMILLTQSLKDIRMEMNLMRKHMASDTEVMLKSLMNAQQKQFQDEMRIFQERTFKILKVFDPSMLKEIHAEMNILSKDQEEIKSEIKNLKNKIDLKDNASDMIDLKLGPFLSSLDSKYDSLKSHINLQFTKEKNKFENFEMILKDTFNSLAKNQEKSLSLLSLNNKNESSMLSKKLSSNEKNQIKSFDILENSISLLTKRVTLAERNQQQDINHFNDSIVFPIKNISSSESNLQKEKVVYLDQEEHFENNELIPTKNKILDIDSRIRKLSLLK